MSHPAGFGPPNNKAEDFLPLNDGGVFVFILRREVNMKVELR